MKRRLVVVASVFWVGIAALAHAQSLVGARFTYQGRLYQAGVAQTGLYDMQFTLYNVETGGSPLTVPAQFRPNVLVTSGLFKADMDFGLVPILAGTWLEVGVAPGGTGPGGPFTILMPRQELTPIPRAILSGTTLNIANGVAVRELNGQKDNVTLAGTNGINVSASGGTVTVTSNATSNNLANSIVSRDGLGSFGAGTLSLAGNILLPNTTAPSLGVLFKGGVPFLHNSGNVSTFLGVSAGDLSLGGFGNTAVGYSAMNAPTTGGFNSAFGVFALGPNSSGQSNSAFGVGAMQSNSAGSNNAAFGTFALSSNAGGGQNAAFGDSALASSTGSSNNSAFGASALYSNTTGFLNSAFGTSALRFNTDGQENAAFGFEALLANTSGNLNSAFGKGALAANTTGGGNVAVGYGALDSHASGVGNIGIGYIALTNLTSGDTNIAIGLQGGTALTTGSNNIYIGAGAGGGSVESNTIRLGHSGHTATLLAGAVSMPGNASVAGNLSFGAQTRQMVNLWSTVYGIGVQAFVQYFRTDSGNPLHGFAWYKGGVHADAAYDAGGGVTLMTLTQSGLTVNGAFVSSSDRALKQDVAAVNSQEILERVSRLPISEWSYKADPGVRHVGPMAQDFRAAFSLGQDDRHIATVDADGVALAAIQALHRLVELQAARLAAQEAELARLKTRLEAAR